MSKKKENIEEEKEQSSSRSGLTDEQIEAALNACTFGYLREKCRNCPLDSDKEPCMTNLHLAALAYIRRLKHRAKVSERALRDIATYCAKEDFDCFSLTTVAVEARAKQLYDGWVQQAEKELAEEGKR